jgi:hypothetical protein
MKLATHMIVAGALIAGTTLANAQGASNQAPGQMMQEKGSVKGDPGASGYAPGDQMHDNGSVKGSSGASGYAPGRATTGASTTTDVDVKANSPGGTNADVETKAKIK